jgi:menaquinone-dependent protoporphyrinogen oxidase
MKILVAFATRSGSTGEIAGRIAERLQAAGHETVVQSVTATADVAGFEAFVVGSAVYIGRWQKEAVEFVQHNRSVLADRPTWLFSSGPLGSEPTDAKGHDKREGASRRRIQEADRSCETARPPRLRRCPEPRSAQPRIAAHAPDASRPQAARRG